MSDSIVEKAVIDADGRVTWLRHLSYWDLECYVQREVDRALFDCYGRLRDVAEMAGIGNMQDILTERLQELELD